MIFAWLGTAIIQKIESNPPYKRKSVGVTEQRPIKHESPDTERVDKKGKELVDLIFRPPEHKDIQLIEGCLERTMRIGTELSPQGQIMLIEFLRMNVDVFAWSSEDIVGIDPRIITHSLKIDPKAKSVTQKKRYHGHVKDKIIRVEVERLLMSKQIREIHFTEWLCNVVLVAKGSKKDNKWRM